MMTNSCSIVFPSRTVRPTLIIVPPRGGSQCSSTVRPPDAISQQPVSHSTFSRPGDCPESGATGSNAARIRRTAGAATLMGPPVDGPGCSRLGLEAADLVEDGAGVRDVIEARRHVGHPRDLRPPVGPRRWNGSERDRPDSVRSLRESHGGERVQVKTLDVPPGEERDDEDPLVRHAVPGPRPLPGIHEEPAEHHVNADQDQRNADDREAVVRLDRENHPEDGETGPEDRERNRERVGRPQEEALPRAPRPEKLLAGAEQLSQHLLRGHARPADFLFRPGEALRDFFFSFAFGLTRSGSFALPVSRFHSSKVSGEISPLTRSSANFRRWALLLNGISIGPRRLSARALYVGGDRGCQVWVTMTT